MRRKMMAAFLSLGLFYFITQNNGNTESIEGSSVGFQTMALCKANAQEVVNDHRNMTATCYDGNHPKTKVQIEPTN